VAASSQVKVPAAVPERLPEPVAPPVRAADAAGSTGDESGLGAVEGVPGGVGDGSGAGAGTGVGEGSETDEETVWQPGGDVVAPRILFQVQPRYPSAARLVKVEGIVIIEAVIDASGQIRDARVLRGHPLLDEAALEALRRWRFEPGRLNGRPVAVYFTLTVNFRLR